MRLKYSLFILLFLSLSCVEEQDIPFPGGTVTATIPYTAVVQGSDPTRASIDGEFGTGSYIFQTGDKLYISYKNGDDELYGALDIISGVGTGYGTFDGALTCVGTMPSDEAVVSATLVGPNSSLYTIDGNKITKTEYPSSIAYESGGLADYVKKYSNFTSSNAFGAKSFILEQQTVFLDCVVKDVPKSILADPDETSVIIKKGSFSRTFTEIPLGTGTYLGDISFIGVFSSNEDISSGEIWVEDDDVAANHCLPDFSSTLSLQANHYYAVNRKATEWNGFKIKATEDGTTVTFQFSGDGIKYSLDNGRTWTAYNAIAAIPATPLAAGEFVCWKGERTEYNCIGSKQLFTANHLCYISGNITSLLADPSSLNDNAFRSAFSYGKATDNNANLEKNIPLPDPFYKVDWIDIDPSDPLILPASTAANCYMEMFMGCTSLTTAPDLPATDLADKCYFRMFYSCTGLTSIPTLPSVVTMSGTTTRRRYCFQMFQSCTGITRLEGSLFGGTMTLQANCFEDMFANCTGLTYVDPGFLPATTLAASCYRGMFQSTRIKTAPDLLVEELVSECYRFMFNSCSQLKNVKCLATTNLGYGYTTNWLRSVPNNNTCTFVKASTATWTRDAHGIPSNWTVTTAP